MSEIIEASDADDLEEGEIPSSEDEDESKDAQTANKYSESSNKGDDNDSVHEEPEESRKRQRDSSPASSTADACNSIPDHPKVRPSGKPSHHCSRAIPNMMLYVTL